MIRSRAVAILLVLAALVPTTARAVCIGTQNNFIPTYIDVYGCRGGTPDPAGGGAQNRVIVRHVDMSPAIGDTVRIRFCSDVKIYSTVPGHPELRVSCGFPATVTAVTDGNGVAQFWLVGASINSNGNPIGAGKSCATILAPMYSIGGCVNIESYPTTVAVYDENGAVGVPGVEGGDMAGWLGDFGKKETIGYKGRSDYTHNGSVEGGDLALWLKVFGLGNSREGGGPLCP